MVAVAAAAVVGTAGNYWFEFDRPGMLSPAGFLLYGPIGRLISMRRVMLGLLTAVLAFGAEDDWDKVRALRGGTEIRVFKKGSTQPIVAKMDEAGDENLVVVLKNEQLAIPRDQIDRVDARPNQGGGRTTRETKTTMDPPDGKAAPPARVKGPDGPSASTSTSLSIGGKPGFETVYRRRAGASARP